MKDQNATAKVMANLYLNSHDINQNEKPTTDLFDRIYQSAKYRNQKALAVVLDEAKISANIFKICRVGSYKGLFQPASLLAAEGDHEGVQFLMEQGGASIHEIVIGYALSGRTQHVEECLEKGANINQAVFGYAWRGDIAAARDLLTRGASGKFFMRGLACGGHVDWVNQFLALFPHSEEVAYGYMIAEKENQLENILNENKSETLLYKKIAAYVRLGQKSKVDEILMSMQRAENYNAYVNYALYEFARLGDHDSVQELLNQGGNIDHAYAGYASGNHVKESTGAKASLLNGYAQGGWSEKVEIIFKELESELNHDDRYYAGHQKLLSYITQVLKYFCEHNYRKQAIHFLNRSIPGYDLKELIPMRASTMIKIATVEGHFRLVEDILHALKGISLVAQVDGVNNVVRALHDFKTVPANKSLFIQRFLLSLKNDDIFNKLVSNLKLSIDSTALLKECRKKQNFYRVSYEQLQILLQSGMITWLLYGRHAIQSKDVFLSIAVQLSSLPVSHKEMQELYQCIVLSNYKHVCMFHMKEDDKATEAIKQITNQEGLLKFISESWLADSVLESSFKRNMS